MNRHLKPMFKNAIFLFKNLKHLTDKKLFESIRLESLNVLICSGAGLFQMLHNKVDIAYFILFLNLF